MSFVHRQIDVTFQLNANPPTDGTPPGTPVQFDSNGNDTLALSGLRCEATVDYINGISLGALQLRIFGMKQSDMNALSNLGKLYMEARRNIVTVTAGDTVSGMAQVFTGTIYSGFIDYAQPDVSFNVLAQTGYYEKLKPTTVITLSGTVSVATAIQTVANNAGLAFSNNGVTQQLSNVYFDGTAVDQIQAIAQAAGIAYAIENNTVYIWPNGGTRDSQTIELSPDTGLIGYPVYSPYGIVATSLFNSDIKNGRKVHVTSDAIGATGDWYVQVVTHSLSSQTPNGPWFTTAQMTGDGVYMTTNG